METPTRFDLPDAKVKFKARLKLALISDYGEIGTKFIVATVDPNQKCFIRKGKPVESINSDSMFARAFQCIKEITDL